MLALILLLMIRIQTPTPPTAPLTAPPSGAIEQTDPLDPLDHIANPTCTKLGTFYEYDGWDGLAGFAVGSCDDAYRNWQRVIPPKPRYLA